MADPNPTVGELFKAKAVTDDQVNAAIADGCSLDLAAAAAERGA